MFNYLHVRYYGKDVISTEPTCMLLIQVSSRPYHTLHLSIFLSGSSAAYQYQFYD